MELRVTPLPGKRFHSAVSRDTGRTSGSAARSYDNNFNVAAHSGLSVGIGYDLYYDQLNRDSDGVVRKPTHADYPDTILSKFHNAIPA